MNILEWLKYTLDIEKPSDVLIWAGFSIIFLTFIVWWCTILVQMYQTNPLLGIFMSIVSVGFTFIFIGLGLYQKGS